MKKHLLFPLIAALIILVLITCKKTPEIIDLTNKKELPTLSTSAISNITPTTATSGGDVTNDGNCDITARGVCWSTSDKPTLENNLGFTSDGSGTGNFTSSITDLTNNTTYYLAAYATNERGTTYGSTKNFTALEITLAVVTTTTPTDIQTNSATSGGNVTSDGNGTMTARGICWNTTENPSIDNNIGYTSDGSGTGSFMSNITGLTDNTTYYIVAYATNEKGTSYGSSKSFFTLELTLLEVTTDNPTDIQANSATSGGEVTNDGNSTVTARGVCWNTSGSPTLDNNLGYTSDGSGTGSFTSNVTGLTENTTYYVAAYAANEKGITYGSSKSFSTLELTLPEVTTTTPTDIQTNSAISGGNVINDDNSAVTARGVCWNTTGNPTLDNNLGYTTDGSGTGSFLSNITNLDDNTTYYVAAYAIYEQGIAYGVVMQFVTLEVIPSIIVINELMSKVLTEEYAFFTELSGDFADWVELVNTGETNINLAGCYFSNKGEGAAEEDLFSIPYTDVTATTVFAGSRLMVVFGAADEYGNAIDGTFDGVLFIPIGLKASRDEAVAIFNLDKSLMTVSVKFNTDGPFGALEDDKSIGRISDGNNEWQIFNVPTPNMPNN